MYWFMDSRFKVAFATAKQVVDEMNYKSGAVDINEVIRVVEKLKGVDIKIVKEHFDNIDSKFGKCGAAMSVWRGENKECEENVKYEAVILLNNVHPFAKMRFSLAHELGHIMSQIPAEVNAAERQFVVSMHINTNITSLEITPKSSQYEVNEQIANIFALLILMPSRVFTTVYDLLQDKKMVADYFGVAVDAVESRLKLEC